MKKRTITLKNELPELLEAVCEHPDCPDWLKHDIWDSFNDRADANITYTASYWRSYLEQGLRMDDPRDFDKCRMPGCDADVEVFTYCIACVEKKVAATQGRSEAEWPEVVQ